jgi:hypothetical protein
MCRQKTIDRIFTKSSWLSTDELCQFQGEFPNQRNEIIRDWLNKRMVFSVRYNGHEYFAKYQFDTTLHPLPVIKEIIEAFGIDDDPWALAAWFEYPNSWIVSKRSDGIDLVAPKDALDRTQELVNAARVRKGSYVC